MIDNIQEMPKSGVQKISMLNLKKLVKEYRNARVGRQGKEKETEAHERSQEQ